MPKVHLRIARYMPEIDSLMEKHPYFLVETFISADGWRTRVCDGLFAGLAEAEARKLEIIAMAEEKVL